RRHTSFSRDWSSDVCSSDLDVAVREEHAALGVVQLFDRAPGDVPGLVEAPVQLERQLAVAWRVGRVVMVEGDAEVGEVALVRGRSEERRVGKGGRARGARGA